MIHRLEGVAAAAAAVDVRMNLKLNPRAWRGAVIRGGGAELHRVHDLPRLDSLIHFESRGERALSYRPVKQRPYVRLSKTQTTRAHARG